MREEISYDNIKREDSVEKFETLNYISSISPKFERPTFSTYLIVKNYQRAQNRQSFNLRIDINYG